MDVCKDCGPIYGNTHKSFCSPQRRGSPPTPGVPTSLNFGPQWPTPARPVRRHRSTIPLSVLASAPPVAPMSTGFDAFDVVLGGRLVPGCTVLLVGQSGVGATTLGLQVAERVAQSTPQARVLLATSELSRNDISAAARRLGLSSDRVLAVFEGEAHKITDHAQIERPVLLVLDSLNTSYLGDVEDDVGTRQQVKALANWFGSFGKETDTAVLLLAHATHEVRGVDHLVDVVVALDPLAQYVGRKNVQRCDFAARVLATKKTRQGPCGTVAGLELTERGFVGLTIGMKQRVIDFASRAV